MSASPITIIELAIGAHEIRDRAQCDQHGCYDEGNFERGPNFMTPASFLTRPDQRAGGKQDEHEEDREADERRHPTRSVCRQRLHARARR